MCPRPGRSWEMSSSSAASIGQPPPPPEEGASVCLPAWLGFASLCCAVGFGIDSVLLYVGALWCAEKKCLNSELWHACAGPLVCLPTVGTRVVYFPQGHSEQVSGTPRAVSLARPRCCW